MTTNISRVRKEWLGILLAACLFPGLAAAQAPERITFQGTIVSLPPSATTPTDGTYTFDARIFDAASDGTEVYAQSGINAHVASGAYTLSLTPATAGNLNTALATTNDRFLEIEVVGGPAGPTYPHILLPRQRLASVPYALSVPKGFADPDNHATRHTDVTTSGTQGQEFDYVANIIRGFSGSAYFDRIGGYLTSNSDGPLPITLNIISTPDFSDRRGNTRFLVLHFISGQEFGADGDPTFDIQYDGGPPSGDCSAPWTVQGQGGLGVDIAISSFHVCEMTGVSNSATHTISTRWTAETGTWQNVQSVLWLVDLGTEN